MNYQTIEVNGQTVFYRECGEKNQPVFLLAPWPLPRITFAAKPISRSTRQ